MRDVGQSIKDRRLKLKKGLQREFFNQIKKISNLTWRELAIKIGISGHTLMVDWRQEKSTIPYTMTRNLLKKYPFEDWKVIESNWIEKILPEDWRQKKLAEKIKKKINIPEKSESLAEIFGVVLGDGHLERKTLTITGNAYEMSHYLYLSKKFKELFGLSPKIFKLKNQNTINLKINSVELISFLLDNNFVLGNKIKNRGNFPNWIFEKQLYVCGALRGLFDTDGGIYQKQKNYKRAIIEFQTKSPSIRESIHNLLNKINFKSSKSSSNVRIQNQKEVLNFFKIVGSSNSKNIIRYKHFIKNGTIPLKQDLIKESISLRIKEPFKAALV